MISMFVLVVREDVLCLSYCPIAVRRQHDQESLESNGGLAHSFRGLISDHRAGIVATGRGMVLEE